MKKNMYSLILAEDVVDEIDKMADAEGTNRSYLINRILADYVGIDTPEKTITDIFKRIENIFGGASDTINYRNHDNTLSIKSALKYKYRPTLRYEVELYRSPTGAIGELNVNFRTQSPELLTKLTEFFGLWRKMEELYVTSLYKNDRISYSLEENKWTRSLCIPSDRHYDPETLSYAISNYVKVFDKLLKNYLGDVYKSVTELENDYLSALNGGLLTI